MFIRILQLSHMTYIITVCQNTGWQDVVSFSNLVLIFTDPKAHNGNVAVPVSITFLFLIIIAAAGFGYLLWRRKGKPKCAF